MDLFDLVATIRLNAEEFRKGIDNAKKEAQSFASSVENISKDMSSAWKGTKEVFEPAVKGYQAVESVGKKAGDIIKKGVTGFMAASTAVGGFGAAAVNAGMSFDSSMSQVSAISGATGEDFDALRKKALEMGATTQFSASEAAEAMTYMGMAGWKTNDMLSGIAGIMNLAAASGEDLASTSDIVTDALTAFGLQAGDSGHFANIMAVAASNANTNVGMMGETFKYVAPVAGALGYSVDDTAMAIGLMANSGIKASQAGTSLRSIMTRLSTDAGASSKSLGALGVLTEKLGVNFYDTEGNARDLNSVLEESRAAWQGLSDEQAISYAKTIAGQEAMSGWLALMNAAPADIDKLTESLVKADDGIGAAAEMASTMMDNLAGDIKLFQSAMESLQITISDALTPSLREFAQFGTNAMEQLTLGFQEGGGQGFFDALEGIVTDAVTMLSERAPTFALASIHFIEALANGILEAKDAVLDAGGQIITYLVDFIWYELENYFPDFIEFGKGIVEMLFSGFTQAGEVISMYIGEFVPLIAEAFFKYHEALFTVGIDILGAIGRGIVENKEKIQQIASETISNMVTALRDNAPDIIDGAIALLDALVSAIIDNLPLILEAGAKIVTHLVAGISGNIPAIVLVVGTMITEVAKIVKVAADIGKAFGDAASLVSKYGSSIIGAVKNIGSVAGTVFGAIKTALSGLFALIAAHPVIAVIMAVIAALVLLYNKCEWFRDGVNSVCHTVIEFFKQLGDGIISAITDAAEFLGEVFTTTWDTVRNAWNAAGAFFSAIASEIRDALGAAIEFVSNGFKSAWEAVKSAWSAATGFFKGIGDGILNAFLGIPSKLADIGKNLIGGLVSGITGALPSALSAAGSAVQKVKAKFTDKSGFDVHSPSRWAKKVFQNVMEGGVEGIKAGTHSLTYSVWQAVDRVKDEMELEPLSISTEDAGFEEDLNAAAETFLAFIGRCRDAVDDFAEWYQEKLDEMFEWFSTLLDGIAETFAEIQGSFLAAWDEITAIWEAAPDWFAEICENIRLTVETVTASMQDYFAEAFSAVQETWAQAEDFFAALWDAITGIFSQAPDWFGETFAAALEAVQSEWDPAAVDFFTDTWEHIIDVFSDAEERFHEIGVAAMTGLQEGAESRLDALLAAMEEIKQSIADAFSDLPDIFREIGTSAMDALADVVTSRIEGLKTQVSDLVQSIADAADKLSGIGEKAEEAQATAKKTVDAAKKTAENVKNGVEKAAETTKATAEKANNIVESVKKPLVTIGTLAPGKTPTQINREEKAGYGKTIYGKTPTQVNREDAAKIAEKKTSTIDLSSKAIGNMSPAQINRLDKLIASGLKVSASGFGGGVGQNAVSTTATGKAVTKTEPMFSFTFNSPKAMDPVEAVRAARRVAQQISLSYV